MRTFGSEVISVCDEYQAGGGVTGSTVIHDSSFTIVVSLRDTHHNVQGVLGCSSAQRGFSVTEITILDSKLELKLESYVILEL